MIQHLFDMQKDLYLSPSIEKISEIYRIGILARRWTENSGEKEGEMIFYVDGKHQARDLRGSENQSRATQAMMQKF